MDRLRLAGAVALVVLVGGVWRAALAVHLPCISRDGAKFEMLAQSLDRGGWEALRAADFDQHPLFPVAILGTHRLLRLVGAENSATSWLFAGQAVALICGIGVIVLIAVITANASAGVPALRSSRAATILAAGLAALLPLNTALSADVMSEPLALCFFLTAVLCFLRPNRGGRMLACGVFSGLAFLVRPEGAVALIGGAAAVLRPPARLSPTRRLGLLVLLAMGFLSCAIPYWGMVGRLSSKSGKEPVSEWVSSASVRVTNVEASFRPAAPVARPFERPALAVLQRYDFGWRAAPVALYALFRAGRVVVPVLALMALWHERRRLLQWPWIGVSVCVALHFLLTVLLLYRYGYLDPRHTLPAVELLIVPAAMALSALWTGGREAGRAPLAVLAIGACLAPLAIYSLRLPNGADAFVARSAQWLTANEQDLHEKLLLGGSSQRRMAFYAGMRFQPWPESEPDPEARYAALVAHILHNRPDYFAIELGPGREREGNERLLERLRSDERLKGRMEAAHIEPSEPGGRMMLIAFRWEAGD